MQLPEEYAECPLDLIHTYLRLGKLAYERMQIASQPVESCSVKHNPVVVELVEQPTSSATKGLLGETEVQNILERNYLVKNVAKFNKTGDMIVRRKPGATRFPQKILVEVKNYSGTVPAKEIEKMYRDLQVHANFSAAVMVSLRSDIAGMRNVEFHMARLDRDVPVMFVCSNHPDVILTCVEMVFTLIGNKLRRDDVNSENLQLLGQMYEKISDLSDVLGSMSAARNILHETRTAMSRSIQSVCDKMFTHEHRIEKLLRDIQVHMGQIQQVEEYSDKKICEPRNRLDMAVGLLRRMFGGTHMFRKYKDAEKILVDMSLGIHPDFDQVEIHVGSTSAHFWFITTVEGVSERDCMLQVNLMKTKTEIRVKAVKNGDTGVTIPVGFQYASGWFTFSLDATFVSVVLPQLLEFFQGKSYTRT
jgi:hypothetical protein